MKSLILLLTVLAFPAYASPTNTKSLNGKDIPSNTVQPEPLIPSLEAIREVVNMALWQAIDRPNTLPDGGAVDVFVIDDGGAHSAGVTAIIKDLACDTPSDCSIEVFESSFKHCPGIPDNQACLIAQIRQVIRSQSDSDTPTLINLSLGWESDSKFPLKQVIEEAADAGILVLASVGNRTHDNSEEQDERGALMPAAWENVGISNAEMRNSPIIYAVGATDFEGKSLATQRADAIPLRNAPGVLLMSRQINEQISHGTSGATAVVTALAAVIWSLDPQLSAEEVMAHVDRGRPDTLAGETTDLCYADECSAPRMISFRTSLASITGIRPRADHVLSPLSSKSIQEAWSVWKNYTSSERKAAVVPQGKISGCLICLRTPEKIYLKLSNPGESMSYSQVSLLTSEGDSISVELGGSLNKTLIIGQEITLGKNEYVKALSYLINEGDGPVDRGLSPIMQAR